MTLARLPHGRPLQDAGLVRSARLPQGLAGSGQELTHRLAHLHPRERGRRCVLACTPARLPVRQAGGQARQSGSGPGRRSGGPLLERTCHTVLGRALQPPQTQKAGQRAPRTCVRLRLHERQRPTAQPLVFLLQLLCTLARLLRRLARPGGRLLRRAGVVAGAPLRRAGRRGLPTELIAQVRILKGQF
jgi:hypothetical protein